MITGRSGVAQTARAVCAGLAVAVERGPNTISREDVQRKIVVQANVAGRDLGSSVGEIRRRVSEPVPMRAGYPPGAPALGPSAVRFRQGVDDQLGVAGAAPGGRAVCRAHVSERSQSRKVRTSGSRREPLR